MFFVHMYMCVSASLVVTLCAYSVSPETLKLRDRGLAAYSSKPFASVVGHERVSQPRTKGFVSSDTEQTLSKTSYAAVTGPMEDGHALMSFVDHSRPCLLGAWLGLCWDYQRGLGLCLAA